MPELPEVETTVRALRRGLVERTIAAVRAIDYPPLVEPLSPERFAKALMGRRVSAVGRRGKFLLLHLEGGTTLAVHLRMSGRLLLTGQQRPVTRHTHAVFDLDDGQSLHFCDARKFGRMRLMTPAGLAELDACLGPEPLDSAFTTAVLAERLRAHPRAGLKALLLDQRFLAGLGNIYADETLFRARLHPKRLAHSLSLAEVTALHQALVEVLSEAIAAEGSTLADGAFLFGSGESGRFAARLRVYGRTGQPCPECGEPLVRQVVAGRSSHFCPRCQV